jgi:hypothetical protein
MSLKVKNFTIQAKAIESNDSSGNNETYNVKAESKPTSISESMKEEIVNESLERIIQFLESKKII